MVGSAPSPPHLAICMRSAPGAVTGDMGNPQRPPGGPPGSPESPWPTWHRHGATAGAAVITESEELWLICMIMSYYIYKTLYNMSESCGNWIQHTRFVTSSAKSYLSHLWHCSMSQRTPSLQKSSTINIKDHQRESQFQEFSLQLNLHCSWRTSSLWSGHNGTIARF